MRGCSEGTLGRRWWWERELISLECCNNTDHPYWNTGQPWTWGQALSIQEALLYLHNGPSDIYLPWLPRQPNALVMSQSAFTTKQTPANSFLHELVIVEVFIRILALPYVTSAISKINHRLCVMQVKTLFTSHYFNGKQPGSMSTGRVYETWNKH